MRDDLVVDGDAGLRIGTSDVEAFAARMRRVVTVRTRRQERGVRTARRHEACDVGVTGDAIMNGVYHARG